MFILLCSSPAAWGRAEGALGWSGLWAWIAALLGKLVRMAVGEAHAHRFDAASQRLPGGDSARGDSADAEVEGGGAARGDRLFAAWRGALSLALQSVRDAQAGVCAGAGRLAAQVRQGAGFHQNDQRRNADLRPQAAGGMGRLVLWVAEEVSRRFRGSREPNDRQAATFGSGASLETLKHDGQHLDKKIDAWNRKQNIPDQR